MKFLILCLLFFCPHVFAMTATRGTSEAMAFEVEPLLRGLEIPWGLEFLTPNKLIFTERPGRISILDLRTRNKVPLSGAPEVFNQGQGGLLDIKKHPKYPQVPWVYITYSKKVRGGATTALARFKINGKNIIDFQDIFVAKAIDSRGYHFGSRIAFDEKGFLYASVGERGNRDNAQNNENHGGTIVRLFDDGRIPKDNPLSKDKKSRPEIWSFGHRNPQGMVFDQKEKRLWAIEHGPRGGDELNLIAKGLNYGWPKQSYGREYSSPAQVGNDKVAGVTQPTHYYVPSIAPCGLDIYSGNVFPKWQGNLFTGSLKFTHLNRIVIKNGKFVKEERLLEDLNQRVRAVRQGPDGYLYFSTDSGYLYRIVPGKKASRKKTS